MEINGRPHGAVWLPSSKSYAHRALLAAGLAGDSRVDRIIWSKDTEATLGALTALGAKVSRSENAATVEKPMDGGSLTEIDCGESGSTLRFLIPLVAALREHTTFIGHGRLMERPLTPYEQALGKQLTFIREGERLTVTGRLIAGDFRLPGDVSSQFITGLLFALPLLAGDSTLTLTTPLQSASYVDLTLEVLAAYGVRVTHENYTVFRVAGGQRYRPADYKVGS